MTGTPTIIYNVFDVQNTIVNKKPNTAWMYR